MSDKRYGMKTKPRRNCEELLKSITRERALLNSYFQDLAAKEPQSTSRKDVLSNNLSPKATSIQKRDSYDLFFESACISIKSLPPKLAAEAKSRISQIITEFELRAISEEEAQQEKEKQQIVKTVRVTTDPLMDPSSEIVYEFQPFT